MNILVAGGSGFIGSNFVRYMLKDYREYKIINVDKLTYAGNLENLSDIESNVNYSFIEGDIIDRKVIDSTVKQHKINVIVNFAAESHVDRSIENPNIFVQTNIQGTQVLLDVAKENKIDKFIQISTDEVYGSLGEKGYFTEETPLDPSSPYAASKAAADMLVLAYYKTYKLDVNITRCSNNYGAYQFPEKLIPLMIINAMEDRHLPLYGDGRNVRDWLHVNDHCNAIDLVLHNGKPGEIYNIGGNQEKRNIQIVKEILTHLGKPDKLVNFVEDRMGHDWRYAIDASKIKEELGWSASYTFNDGLIDTIQWYVENEQWWRNIQSGKYKVNA